MVAQKQRLAGHDGDRISARRISDWNASPKPDEEGIVRNFRQTIGSTPWRRATDSILSAASSLVQSSAFASLFGIGKAGEESLLALRQWGVARLAPSIRSRLCVLCRSGLALVKQRHVSDRADAGYLFGRSFLPRSVSTSRMILT